MKGASSNTKIQQPSLFKRIANFFRRVWNKIKNWLSLPPTYVKTVRMQSGKSSISLGNFGKLEITSNVTLQDIEEFCEVNEPVTAFTESTRYGILESVIDHLHSPNSTTDQNEVYRNIMRFIYKKGFDFNKKHSPGMYGNTELLWDISYGKAITPEASLILLREFDANPFICDKDNKNALHFLLLKGHDVQRRIVDEVLNHKDIKKHIDDKTIYGDIALHIACARRDEKFIAQLLEKGASLEIKNKNGQTPIDILHLSEQERLEFLSSKAYLNLSHIANRDLEYLATIDKEIFNSDPQAIEAKIQKMKKVTIQEEVKGNVMQSPTLSNPVGKSRSI
ncbi:ankyrin repeat domain-containing protein [Candidatus Mesenet endosymbiont of Phosphuga atrata]|uniref:ankyrin repeat domain-containing protein n=1 Tax=Candidatus Mesenet endosymbiont of Phosphuga atrata TaxID=3066221 RepID=UPI0030D52F1E